ncbi:hypothetical protein HMP06_2300 [Sphingomonas sp. HMP6]|nr:hypothetical protein HMP06_2300 [Sphingomonas sp. HMP6]
MIDAMRGLGLKGMAGAFDDAVTTGVQRKRTAMEILTDLLRAEGAHRHAASIRYRITAARLPVLKDLDGHRQLAAVGREERRDAGIGRNHAAIATPVTSAQCVNAWVRAERTVAALARGGREKTWAI